MKNKYIIAAVLFLALIILAGSVDVLAITIIFFSIYAVLASLQRKNIIPLKALIFVFLGAIAFEFTGGKPLLSAYLFEAIKIAKSKGAIAGMTSNGLLLTEETVRRLKDAKLDVLQISLDSASAKEHNQSRDIEGCYEKVMHGAGLAKTAGIKVIISTIVTPKNISDNSILKVIRQAKDMGALITLNPACNVGRWSAENNALLSDELQKKYRELMSFLHVRWAGYMNFFKEGCPCGSETIFISAYGDVLPCGFIQISYGNITEEPLTQIWKKMLDNPLKSAKRHTCMAGLDKDFINTYLEPLNYENRLPLPMHKHSAYKNSLNSGH